MCVRVLALTSIVWGALAHSRLVCPPPRSKDIGAKLGPCDAADDPSLAPVTLAPGLNTIRWEEGIPHPGAPVRLALSMDGSDSGFEECVLLDHIPHDESKTMDADDESTWLQFSITVWIPDVKCERCHLQLVSYMTDEYHGVPIGATCAHPAAKAAGMANASLQDCPVRYHSCAPVRITGNTPRDQYTCSLDAFVKELQYPFMADAVASTYLNRGDPGIWENAVLISGGFPIEGCVSGLYCDPLVYYRRRIQVPPGATYTVPAGPCAAPPAPKETPTAERPRTPFLGLTHRAALAAPHAGCAGADCRVQQLMDLILSSQDKTANFMNLMAADPTCGICVLTCVNTAPKDENSQLACLTACSIPATTVRPFLLSRRIR